MKRFVKLFDELDSTTSTNEKIEALKRYFGSVAHDDAMWAVLLLTGRISKKTLTSRALKDLFLIATQYPEWLLDESASNVGDTAETLSLLAQSLGLCRKNVATVETDTRLTEWMETRIPDIGRIKDQETQARALLAWWNELDQQEVFVLNKLMTGAFRVGVSEKLVVRAIAAVFGIETDQVAHRLTGIRTPGLETFEMLISKDATAPTFSQPYPFCLANSWGDRNEADFNPSDWCIEWKYDGIRSQVIKREDQTWIWSRGEEEITSGFPDLVELFKALPDGTVLDGEIVVMSLTEDGNSKVAPFQDLQKRLGRKKVSPAVLKAQPAGFIAYDCLEFEGRDIRGETLRARKAMLRTATAASLNARFWFSEILEVTDVADLTRKRGQARAVSGEGLMIKSWESPYAVGRKTGNWWKHKVDPLTLDAVLIYAQAGSGRRANLYTDYTFALWNEERQLVPFAKAYSGLDQKEIDELDHWIRRHTKEKFGPVRSVEPHFVFEIGFEGIGKSSRHKSGIAVRFPRILRWRKDKPFEEADTLQTADLLMNEVHA